VSYRAWGTELPADIDVVSVQFPGRLDRIGEPWQTRFGDLVATLVGLLAVDRRPTALFGHSLGSLVAFEVARGLCARNTPVIHLFFSGQSAPPRLRRTTKHLGTDDELWAEVTRLSGTSSEVLAVAELRPLVLPGLRHDYRLAETYEPAPGPPLGCPITALIGRDDPEVDAAEATAWAAMTTGPFMLRVFEGDHFYLQSWRTELLAVITAALLEQPEETQVGEVK
jgi:pyochelin biosynthetic protein PchC